MRPIVSPVFTGSKMRSLFLLMNQCADSFVKHFKNDSKEVKEFEMREIMTKYATEVIASVAFGIEVDSIKQPNNDFYAMGKKLIDFDGFWIRLKLIGYGIAPKIFQV